MALNIENSTMLGTAKLYRSSEHFNYPLTCKKSSQKKERAYVPALFPIVFYICAKYINGF
jgi:hypothetical protein